MAYPPHEPTEDTRRRVEILAACGIPQDVIARLIGDVASGGIDPKTLRKHYRSELTLATFKANAQIAGKLYQKAVGGNVGAMIFWLKTRARWSTRHELTFPDEVQGDDIDLSNLSVEDLQSLEHLASKIRISGPEPEGD